MQTNQPAHKRRLFVLTMRAVRRNVTRKQPRFNPQSEVLCAREAIFRQSKASSLPASRRCAADGIFNLEVCPALNIYE
jgi:hypothetical protein